MRSKTPLCPPHSEATLPVVGSGSEPATSKQIATIRSLGGQVTSHLTNAQASEQISALYAAKRRRDAQLAFENRTRWSALRELWRQRIESERDSIRSAVFDADEGIGVERDDSIDNYRDDFRETFGIDPAFADRTRCSPSVERAIGYVEKVLSCPEADLISRFPEQMSAEIMYWADQMPHEEKLAAWRAVAPQDAAELRKFVVAQLKLMAKDAGGDLRLSDEGEEGLVRSLFGVHVPESMRDVLDHTLEQPTVSWFVDLAVARITHTEPRPLPAKVLKSAREEGFEPASTRTEFPRPKGCLTLLALIASISGVTTFWFSW